MLRRLLIVALLVACAAAPVEGLSWGGGQGARLHRVKARVGRHVHGRFAKRFKSGLSKARIRLKWRKGRAQVRLRRRARAAKLRYRNKLQDVKTTLSSLWERGNQSKKAPEAKRWGVFPSAASLRSFRIPDGTVGDASTAGMVASGVMQAFRMGARFGPVVTMISAPVMGAYAIEKFRKSKTMEGRIDASSLFAWALQGGSEFLRHLEVGKVAGAVTGVVGGMLQAGIGAYRMVSGLRGDKKNRARAVIGGIDVVAGMSWAAYSLNIAFPTSLAIFSVATAARIGYAGYLKYREYKKERGHAESQLHDRMAEIRAMDEAPKAVVIDPVSPFVAARLAQGPKVKEIEHEGRRAYTLPVKATTKDGEEHTIEVIVPVHD